MEKAKSNGGVRKRAPNACSRCRKQKIKCTGSLPCDQCEKRNLVCDFDDQSQKVLVAKSFISDLQKRLASFERINGHAYEGHESDTGSDEQFMPQDTSLNVAVAQSSSLLPEDDPEPLETVEPSMHHDIDAQDLTRARSGTQVESSRTSPGPQLVNPLALGFSAYVVDNTGTPMYLGSSSNWAFCRRVLAMTHERVFQAPPPPERLLYEGKVYDLGWGTDPLMLPSVPDLDPATLPSADFAMYLIDAVKFHCGQFHLFDEDSFMYQFDRYHDVTVDRASIPQIWYIHYLLVIAFGKAFVVRMNKGGKPPGAEMFVQAMKLLPNAILFCPDPVESVEIICCAALYSQSLDFRTLAYRLIGQALRVALGNGMHTGMQGMYVDKGRLERCRKAWWTTYLLDRQMSSLMGVPMAIRDEDISAELPALPGTPQKAKALKLHIKLSRVIAQIFNTIYGDEVNMDKRFVLNVKTALKSIAIVTDELNHAFPISTSGSMVGVTRLSAYLYLLQHQCILLATRPLLFTFLDMRLSSQDMTRSPVPRRGTVRALLHMCVESAQQMLKLLVGLQEQSLLESFLPFDLDPTFTSAIVLLMAAAVDPKILDDHTPWTTIASGILDEMITRGNLIAAFLKSELQQLEIVMKHLPLITHHTRTLEEFRPQQLPRSAMQQQQQQPQQQQLGTEEATISTSQTLVDHPSASDDFSVPDVDWNSGVNTEHLMMVADSLDLEGFNWLPNCFIDPPP